MFLSFPVSSFSSSSSFLFSSMAFLHGLSSTALHRSDFAADYVMSAERRDCKSNVPVRKLLKVNAHQFSIGSIYLRGLAGLASGHLQHHMHNQHLDCSEGPGLISSRALVIVYETTSNAYLPTFYSTGPLPSTLADLYIIAEYP